MAARIRAARCSATAYRYRCVSFAISARACASAPAFATALLYATSRWLPCRCCYIFCAFLICRCFFPLPEPSFTRYAGATDACAARIRRDGYCTLSELRFSYFLLDSYVAAFVSPWAIAACRFSRFFRPIAAAPLIFCCCYRRRSPQLFFNEGGYTSNLATGCADVPHEMRLTTHAGCPPSHYCP